MHKVGVVGAGAMALYLLKALSASTAPLAIEFFESSDEPGCGMPYRSSVNAEYMLCNAFSREIPAPTRTLIDWLRQQSPRELSEWELSHHDLSARAFYPRVLIGDYLQSEFAALCDVARAAGHDVVVHCRHHVRDIVPVDKGLRIVADTPNGGRDIVVVDVVIATGHR